uniref:Uricase n=1 Tax=Phaffia rhodozyma TaxID=264483 RepID=A0A1C9U6A0_PHARH|nr:urate oxidase [Phaffia rhodozyma]
MSDTQEDLGFLSSARYGKDLVRVARVVRTPAADGKPAKQEVVEYVVRALLEGDFAESYDAADNTRIVATDSIKNTTYIMAKVSPHVMTPELFALHLGTHFVTKYSHIQKAHIDIQSLRWSRIDVQDIGAHPHSFVRDGDEKRVVSVVVDGTSTDDITAIVKSGVKDLLVLKTAGSSFTNFLRDEFTTLPEVDDRIFSTSITCDYTVTLPPNIPLTIDNLNKIGAEVQFEKLASTARTTTLEVFATHDSASVQATLYRAAQTILSRASSIKEVFYSLPNKHYMPVNLKPFNLENGKGREGLVEVFEPVASPSGLIQATITRK